MRYKIILDSCGELPEHLQKDERFERVPLGLEIGDYHILDDDDFDQADFLRRIAEYEGCAKSSCPSPERFLEACNTEAEHIYMITISSHLSGSYNSAQLAKQLCLEKDSTKKICVIDSESASGGESQIGMLAMELEEQGLPFEEIERRLNEHRDRMETYFMLDNLETLRKNGRMSGVKAKVVQTLNIKPVMYAPGGIIAQKSQAIGVNKALKKLVECMKKELAHFEERTVVITHCNCPDRAEFVKTLMEEGSITPKKIIVMPMRGLSTLYANDGGIIVSA